MASIETVVQNADVEMGDDSKPDSTAEVKDEPGESTHSIACTNFSNRTGERVVSLFYIYYRCTQHEFQRRHIMERCERRPASRGLHHLHHGLRSHSTTEEETEEPEQARDWWVCC